MRIALIADTFPPLRTSGAVQLRDLSREFARQGHELTVMLPDSNIKESWQLENFDGVNVLRLKAPQTKDISYVRRTFAEALMPFFMRRSFQHSALAHERWDGVVWYSPSIFHAPFANFLKKKNACKAYLIIRDIFPEWAVDMGLMGRGLPYRFFSAIARYQYSVADVIGVQTPGNLSYFDSWRKRLGRRLEVLQNWLDQPANLRCPIRISDTALAGRKIFVYAGNMGVAQGMDILLELATQLCLNPSIGFVFVGRGSESQRLRDLVQTRKLDNILFFNEIHPDEIPDLYSQCHVGLVSLDSRHKSHNIPGKFLTYMQSGLPVLSTVNAGNDIAALIRNEKVGEVCENNQTDELVRLALKLDEQIGKDSEITERCRRLFEQQFSVCQTVTQIVIALSQ